MEFSNNKSSLSMDYFDILLGNYLGAVVSEMTHRMIFIDNHPFFLILFYSFHGVDHL
ncbi:hypothetical protein [Paenibacillus dokdonensis]|uniref:hypothetical protein n=1 Tax=Paenibacillus dokdonensis TaxID=2567944 RepID=UPI003D2E57E3